MEKYIVAFEIGSSKIRGAVGVVDNSGVVDVVAAEEEKLTGSVRYGCIENMEVANAISLICQRLEGYPRVNPRKITGVYVGVGARSLASRQVDVQVELNGETEITPDIVDQLCKKAGATEPYDRDVIDTVPVRFTVDNKQVVTPVGTYGQTVGAKMTVVSSMPAVKRMLRRVFTEKLGLEIAGYATRQLAEAAMVLTDDERRLGSMLVDFGAETTTVAIYKNGAPIYVAAIPLGSRNITLDLTALNYIEERAEEIKKVSGNALLPESGSYRPGADGIDYTEVNNYVHARCGEIIANIIAQLDYAGLRAADLPGGIVIIGGGARLRGFNDMLKHQSKMKVRQGSPVGAIRISDGSVHASEAIDVISLLAAAARLDGPESVEPLPEPEAPVAETSYDAMYGDQTQPNPEQPQKGAKKGAQQGADEEDDDEGDDDDEGGRKRRDPFGWLKRALAGLTRDDDEYGGDEFQN